jgi:hypothetical protein
VQTRRRNPETHEGASVEAESTVGAKTGKQLGFVVSL